MRAAGIRSVALLTELGKGISFLSIMPMGDVQDTHTPTRSTPGPTEECGGVRTPVPVFLHATLPRARTDTPP